MLVIWAKCNDGQIRGFIVNRADAKDRLSTPKIEGKMSLRVSITGMVLMDNVIVPEENVLNVQGLKVSHVFPNEKELYLAYCMSSVCCITFSYHLIMYLLRSVRFLHFSSVEICKSHIIS